MHTQRLETGSDIADMLRAIFRSQAFGFILSNVETGEKRYYYPSQNGWIFDQSLVVADEADLEIVLQRVGETDWLKYVRQQKPNSKWRIALLTNVAFHLYPMEDRPVGRGKITGQLPKWLVENRGLDALEKDKKTGKLYADHLCYFSMLRAIPELRFEKFGKKDPRTGLYLLGQAGASRESCGRAFERFTRPG